MRHTYISMTVTALHSDSTYQEVRSCHFVLSDFISQYHIDVIAVSQTSCRGNTGHQIIFQSIESQKCVLALTLVHHIQMARKSCIQSQMVMTLEHTWQNGFVAKIDNCCLSSGCFKLLAGCYFFNALFFDQNAGIIKNLQFFSDQGFFCINSG